MPNIITSAAFLLTESKKPKKYIFGNFADADANYIHDLPNAYEFFIKIVNGQQILTDIDSLKIFPKELPVKNIFFIANPIEKSIKNAIAVETLTKGIQFAKKKALEENQSHIYIVGGVDLIKNCLKNNLLDEIQLTFVYNSEMEMTKSNFLNFDLNQWKIAEDSGIFHSDQSQQNKITYRHLKLNSKYKLNEF